MSCQDISLAGKGAGIEGERSGLWAEYARLIGELRPEYVIVENVAALLGRGLDRVLGDLASIGFDAEWHCIPASAVGAPHRRDRLWLIAYPMCSRGRFQQITLSECKETTDLDHDGSPRPLAHAYQVDAQGFVSGGYDQIIRREQIERQAGLCSGAGEHQDWSIEPSVGRVAHGIPDRVGQLRAYGNAVVPQIPELIGRAILEARAA